jgi:hypothetical protein
MGNKLKPISRQPHTLSNQALQMAADLKIDNVLLLEPGMELYKALITRITGDYYLYGVMLKELLGKLSIGHMMYLERKQAAELTEDEVKMLFNVFHKLKKKGY